MVLFGWDLLYSSVKDDIKNNNDVLVCFTHLVLISNGFKCIGLGESKNIDGTEEQTETLPSGWNANYTIRYVYQGRLYNLKGTNLDDGVMINLIRVDERTVSLMQLNSRSVAAQSGSLSEMIPEHETIIDLMKRQLIDKVIVSKKTKTTGSQTDPVTSAQPESMRSFPQPSVSSIYPAPGPVGVGFNDLNPLGSIDPLRVIPNRVFPPGGGGMLFQPPTGSGYPTGQGLPPGALPPGARFDPFRPPPDLDRPSSRRSRPDNDEFPPPGYDDMFM